MSEDRTPLIYFWLAFYKDGAVLPQFDFETGKENSFASIDQTKLAKFGLFPFPDDLSAKANTEAKSKITSPVKNLPYHLLKLNEGQRLIYVRRNFIHQFTYQTCERCGYQWQWMPNHVEVTGEVGLPIHQNYIMQFWEEKGQSFPLAQCPKCHTFNAVLCPHCKVLINELKTSPDDKTPRKFECPKCKTEYKRFIKTRDGNKRRIIYLLGQQETTEDLDDPLSRKRNKKFIMFISDDGTFEVSDNFNFR